MGVYLIKELRIRTPNAAILVMTAYANLLDDAKKAGAAEGMTKNFKAEEISIEKFFYMGNKR